MNRLNNKGQTLVLFVCIIPILLIIIGLVVDFGRVNTEKEKLDSINKLAIEYIKENDANTDSISKASDIIIKNDSTITNVKVEEVDSVVTIILDKEVDSVFGKIMNIFKYTIHSSYELRDKKIKRIK